MSRFSLGHRVTMQDVARQAGVSKASVSRFIGEDRGLLSEAIAGRIEQAITTLGYRPNQMARGLKRGRTRLIGMLVADIRNPYSVAVMHGVETACRQHGYTLVLCNTDRDPGREVEQLDALRAYNIEGLILITLGGHAEQLKALRGELPVVLIDRKLESFGTDLVGLDNGAAVTLALDHLLERGYRDIALVMEPVEGASSRAERRAAFETGISARPGIKGRVLYTGEALADDLTDFRGRLDNGPKALFCANGVATLAATLVLAEAGVQAFDTLGLIALDDLDWYPLVGGGITALAQPTDAIGRVAFECLLRRLQGDTGPSRQIDVPARLIVRGSTPRRTHYA
ncbi:LacI family DNA-binding transcriptional regulator [Pseudomonas sp. DC3200b2]|uniref:LacI family DNA-binding transcriptional regulator n=1 Tax=Pseudomonas sp. DC3200b2 TaxID=2804669 RepID=UPI003CEECB7D